VNKTLATSIATSRFRERLQSRNFFRYTEDVVNSFIVHVSTRFEGRPPYVPIDFGPIADWTNKIIRLLDNHMIFSKDNDKYLMVILKTRETGLPVVAFAQAPPPQ